METRTTRIRLSNDDVNVTAVYSRKDVQEALLNGDGLTFICKRCKESLAERKLAERIRSYANPFNGSREALGAMIVHGLCGSCRKEVEEEQEKAEWDKILLELYGKVKRAHEPEKYQEAKELLDEVAQQGGRKATERFAALVAANKVVVEGTFFKYRLREGKEFPYSRLTAGAPLPGARAAHEETLPTEERVNIAKSRLRTTIKKKGNKILWPQVANLLASEVEEFQKFFDGCETVEEVRERLDNLS